MKTVSKQIAGGTKEYTKKDGTKVTQTWPDGTLELECASGTVDNAFAASAVNSQLLHHDASTLWRSTNGFTETDAVHKSIVPLVRTTGKKFYLADGVLCVNWEYVPAERSNGDDKVAAVITMAKVLATALKTTVEQQIMGMVCDKRTKESALEAYKNEA